MLLLQLFVFLPLLLLLLQPQVVVDELPAEVDAAQRAASFLAACHLGGYFYIILGKYWRKSYVVEAGEESTAWV